MICIGERVNDRDLTDQRVARWREAWERNPVGYIRNTPAMSYGPTRERLHGLMSLKPRRIQVVDLLPPDNEPGTWDWDLAEVCALHLLTWLNRGDHDWERFIMLGKRVSQVLVDRNDVEFGQVYDLCGTPALCFPHPSGRSRYLNDDEYKEKARTWARKFLRGV